MNPTRVVIHIPHRFSTGLVVPSTARALALENGLGTTGSTFHPRYSWPDRRSRGIHLSRHGMAYCRRMAAADLVLAALREHGPIDRADGTALDVLEERTGIARGTLNATVRKLHQRDMIVRRVKGQDGKGGTTHVAIAETKPAVADVGEHPADWVAGCQFCQRTPQMACAIHKDRGNDPVPVQVGSPPSSAVAVAAPPERATKPKSAAPRLRAVADDDIVEPAGLREEFLALQGAYAALVDQLASERERHSRVEREQATRIGQLEARVARLTMQRPA